MPLVILPWTEIIVSGTAEGTIKIWNSKSFILILSLTGQFKRHFYPFKSLAIVLSSENIVSVF